MSRGKPLFTKEHDDFMRKHGPRLGFQSKELYDSLVAKFPDFITTRESFKYHSLLVKQGMGIIEIPPSAGVDVRTQELHLPWKTALITSDYQIPYHDEKLVESAFKLAAAWQVDGHVINADFYDFATMSKFPQQLFDERVQLGEELKYGKQIIQQSRELHHKVAFSTGNHEWRVIRKLLDGELDTEQIQEFLADSKTLYTPLSYLYLGYDKEPVRVTHPRSQSVIAGAVGADIARNYDCHVIVAHDHILAQRRSHSGRWTVTHSGMMAKPEKLLYSVTADDRRPRMNQGFVIVHPDSKTGEPRIRLIDAKNVDWDLEFWIAERRLNGLEENRNRHSSSRRTK